MIAYSEMQISFTTESESQEKKSIPSFEEIQRPKVTNAMSRKTIHATQTTDYFQHIMIC